MLEQEKKYKKPVFGLKMGLKGLTLRLFGLKGLILRPQKQGWLKRLDFKPPQLSEVNLSAYECQQFLEKLPAIASVMKKLYP